MLISLRQYLDKICSTLTLSCFIFSRIATNVTKDELNRHRFEFRRQHDIELGTVKMLLTNKIGQDNIGICIQQQLKYIKQQIVVVNTTVNSSTHKLVRYETVFVIIAEWKLNIVASIFSGDI